MEINRANVGVTFAEDLECKYSDSLRGRSSSNYGSVFCQNLAGAKPARFRFFGFNFKRAGEFSQLPRAALLDRQVSEFIDGTSSLSETNCEGGDCAKTNYSPLHSMHSNDSVISCSCPVCVNRSASGRNGGVDHGFFEPFRKSWLNGMFFPPLRYDNPALEELYVLNLREFMALRTIFIAPFMLLLTVTLWIVGVRAFLSSELWKEGYLYDMFQAFMTICCIMFSVPIITVSRKLRRFSEIACYSSMGIAGFLWGFWQIFARCDSGDSYVKIVLSHETFVMLTYIYGFLPIVMLDSLLPSRTYFTRWIHVQFVVLYSVGAVADGYMNSAHVSWIYAILRVVAHVSITSLLFYSGYVAELHARMSLYDWLVVSCKSARLEYDLQRSQSYSKIANKIENIFDDMLICSEMAKHLKESAYCKFPEFGDSLACLTSKIQSCIATMATNQDLCPALCGDIGDDTEKQSAAIDSYIGGNRTSRLFTKSYTMDKNSDIQLKTSTRKQITGLSEALFMVCPEELGKPDFRTLLPREISITERINAKELISDWNVNMLVLFKNHVEPFVTVGQSLLAEFQATYHVPEVVILNFLKVLERLYDESVPYHNAAHAVMVAQKVCCLAKIVGLFDVMTVLDRAIIAVAALAHDVGHPGRTNAFLVNSKCMLAKLFNYDSVLEKFHSCCTFNILKLPECNIFSGFSEQKLKKIRSQIIELILATDMENHFELISRFSLRRNATEFSLEKTEDVLHVSKMLIKAADVSSSVVEWDESIEWVKLLLREFYAQGDEEKHLNLPISALCDRENHSEVAKAQSAFLTVVVLPLYEELAFLNRKDIDEICLSRIRENVERWNEIVELKVPMPPLIPPDADNNTEIRVK